MGKLSNKELMAYAGIGYVSPEHRLSAISVPNEELDNTLNSLRYTDRRSKLAQLMPGIFGEEEQEGTDEYQDVILDKDNKYRKYNIQRDIKTGQIINKVLADDIEGINIEDVISGKVENPLTRQVQEQELFKRIYSDIDPTTDEFKTDISKAWMQEVFDNSIWGAFDKLAGGEVSRQLSNGTIENLEIKNNDIYYGGAKVNIPSILTNDFNEWLNKKSTYQADGFADQLATTASSFLIDAPFFYVGGAIGGKIIEGIAPGLAASTTLPGRLTKHVAQNLAMLSIIDTPRMVNHTIESGTNALLEDIKHTAEFSLLAGGFGTIGDYFGMGVSKLLQKPKSLQLSQTAQFLRRNPQITQTLTTGLTSGMLGYTTGGGTYEEKLATAFTFAAMHFSSPNAWKSYVKGDRKSIMVEDTHGQMRSIQRLIEKGIPLEEAIKQTNASIPDYYFRDGDKLSKINKDIFVTKGEIELIPEIQFPTIELTPESARNYKYITEAVPFAKVTMREALKRGKIQLLTNEIKKEFPANPYNKEIDKEKYEEFEYGKQVLSNNITSTIYANKLNSIFKSRQLPDEPTLNKMIVKLSDTWKLPVSEIRNQIYPRVIDYLENPSVLQRELYVEQGNKILPAAVNKFNKELADAIQKSIDEIIKVQQLKLLPEQAGAIRRPEQLLAEQATIQSKTEGRTYYDLNGELIPLDVYAEGKAKIGNIEFKPDKQNIVTKQQLKKQQRTQQAEDDYVAAEIKKYYDEQIEKGIKPTSDEILQVSKKARVQYGKEQMGKSENRETGEGGLRTETGSSNRPIDVERTQQPSGAVNEETQRVEKPSQIENTQLEAQGKANVEKPIVTPTRPEIESPKRSIEAVLERFKDDSLQKAAENLTSIYEPKTTSYRDESGEIKPEVTQRLVDLENKAEESARKLSTEVGTKVTKEDVLITALKPYYTSAEIGTMFALRNIHSNDAIKNRDFISNRLKKLGLDIGSKAGQVGEINKAEISQAGLETTAIRPITETGLSDAERQVIQQSSEVQNKIASLLQERNLADTTEERKNAINTELQDLYKQKQDLGRRQAELSSDEMLYETQRNIIEKVGANLEERFKIEDEFKQIFGDNIQITWGHPAEKVEKGYATAKTYLDANNKLHIDFSTLASTETALHERLHGQMLMASDGTMVEKILHEANPDYDGIYGSKSWNDAHEQVVKDAMASRKDSYGFTDKLREVWQKLQNFFTRKGWYSSAEFYRKLLANEIEIGKGKPSKPLYETVIDEHSKELEDLSFSLQEYEQRRFTYGKPLSLEGRIRDNFIVRKLTSIGSGLYKAALQNRNIADQRDKHGIPINRITNRVYHTLENKVVLQVHEDINRINENPAGWNKGKEFLELSNKEEFTAKYGKYATDISDKKREVIEPQNVDGGETLDQFMDRVAVELNYNSAEKAVEKRIQTHARETQEQRREGRRAFLKENAKIDNEMILANGLTVNELRKYFGEQLDYEKSEIELYRDANNILSNNSTLADNIISGIIDKTFPMYYGLYRNETRPSNPSYYNFTGSRPIDKDSNYTTDESKTVGFERINGYGKNETEAKEQADKFFAQGFAIETFDKIGELIRKEQFDRLTANQLMNLVDLGHIQANNPIIRSLLNSIKTGNYDQHTINKKYIKGMHYTPEELERGVYALTNESVSASTKRYGLSEARALLAEERANVNSLMKSTIRSESDKDAIKRDLDYATQIYNLVSHGDQSFVDTWRQAATAWYIGIKPSFWFQQMMQPLQTTLPEAIAESRNTIINGNKAWKDAFGKAFELAKYLQAERKGEIIDFTDKEFIELYKKLDAQNLMGAVGIEELAGKGRDLEMRYGSDLYKGWNALLKLANMGGAVAEKFTRMQSLATFYDIGKAKGLEGKALENYLVKNVKNTMGGWGALDRPAVFQSRQLGISEQKVLKAIDKAFFTFKTYANTNLGQYDRLFRNKQWGALGAKAIVGLGMHGVTAFPFVATLFALGNLFSDDNVEYETLKLLDELDEKIGGRFGNIIGKGALSQFGINMQNLFDERTAFATDVFAETRSKSVEGKMAEAMLGAPYGLAKDFVSAGDATIKLMKNLISDDVSIDEEEKKRAIKNLYKFSPLFFRNILNAMSMTEDGVQLRGKEILKADNISWSDVVYKVLGFNPTKISDTYEYQFSGTPAKLSRTKGRITELKKIRKEITSSPSYSSEEKRTELIKIAQLMREIQKEEAILTRQSNIEKQQQAK